MITSSRWLIQRFVISPSQRVAIAGALPVGVDSFHDDSPFWNGTAHAMAHEIWIEPVSRFLGTLAVYLKRF